MKTSNVYRSLAFRVLTLIITGLLSTQSLVAQGWFDNHWSYRRQVTVPNPGTVVLTDFQVKITLDNTFEFPKALADGSDIRITVSDGTTLIPFWIEEWNVAGTSASIWVKVPAIATVGTNVYIYYGNPSPTDPSAGDPVEVPPVGPFTRAAGNPVVPAGATGTSLLAENIVYDPVTGHYWMCLANYSQAAISLCYSDTPANPASWTWSGNVITTFTSFYSGAPHLVYNEGTWYLFYADRPNIEVATASNVAGPYTILTTPVLQPSAPTGAWDSYRVDEPYVFQRNDGKWILIYMGDAGSITEQIGYAVADNIIGPYTTYAGNPCITFGPPGSIDAGTVADPWVYEYHGVYYIGYTVSDTKTSPWETALVTTADWLTFTRHGLILPAAGTTNDAANSFRGALTRIGDEYVFSYTNDGYRMAIATQPVYMTTPDIINNPDAVFDFFDGFNGTALDVTKWTIANGQASMATLSNGLLTLSSLSASAYIRLLGTSVFGMNYIGETRASHPDQGTQDLIAEIGFSDFNFTTVRITDDFKLGTTYWQRQAKIYPATDDTHLFYNMAQTADREWHTFRIFREGANTVGYQIDDNVTETTTTNVPTAGLPPFLMSFGTNNDLIVDWTRVRKWAGSDPVITIGSEEGLATQWTGAVSSIWTDAGNWTAGVPAAWSRINIHGSAHVAVFAGTLNIDPAASLAIEPDGALTVNGDLNSNGLLTISSTLASSGSLIVTGTGTGSLTYSRQLQPGPDATRNWHLGAIPVINNTETNAGKISAINEWAEIPGSWNPIVITASLPGRGYNFRQTETSDGAISFKGSLVDEDIVVAASSPYADAVGPGDNYFTRSYVAGRSLDNFGGGGWNLLGNPYTSAIEAQGFIDANYSLTPALSQFDPNYVALYLFDGTTRRYYYVAGSTGWPNGTELNETHVQAGQGFFVLAMNDNSEFRFTRAMQEHSTGTPMLKSAAADDRWPGLQLKVKFSTGEGFTTVVYGNDMTRGLDPGYDIGLFNSGQAVEVYTTLVLKDNGVNFARQALPVSGADTITVPVGIDLEKGGEVTFSALTVPLGNMKFWLEDRLTGTFTDLGAGSYTVTLPAKTYGTGRFFLKSAGSITGIDTPDEDLNQPAIRIWTSQDKVIIKGVVSEGATAEVYDFRGTKILETLLTDEALNTLTLPSGLHGVYLVRVANGGKIYTQKVVLR